MARIEQLIEYVQTELEYARNPAPYDEESYYDYMRGKESALEDVLSELRRIQKEDQKPGTEYVLAKWNMPA
jgi:hypothetical protein